MLAFLQGEEPAASRIRSMLHEARDQEVELFVSIINLGEVVYRVGKVRGETEAAETLAQIRRLPITIVSASDDAVWAAVRYKTHYAISYADAFAVATAETLGAKLATGDPELVQLATGVPIEELERGHRAGGSALVFALGFETNDRAPGLRRPLGSLDSGVILLYDPMYNLACWTTSSHMWNELPQISTSTLCG